MRRIALPSAFVLVFVIISQLTATVYGAVDSGPELGPAIELKKALNRGEVGQHFDGPAYLKVLGKYTLDDYATHPNVRTLLVNLKASLRERKLPTEGVELFASAIFLMGRGIDWDAEGDNQIVVVAASPLLNVLYPVQFYRDGKIYVKLVERHGGAFKKCFEGIDCADGTGRAILEADISTTELAKAARRELRNYWYASAKVYGLAPVLHSVAASKNTGKAYSVFDLYDVDAHDPEFVQGLDFAGLVLIFIDLAHKVEQLHSVKFLHRDIKPSNIVGTKDGRDIRLIDFGLSCRDGSPQMLNFSGAPGWIEPQLMDRGYLLSFEDGTSADRFSLAAALLYLVVNYSDRENRHTAGRMIAAFEEFVEAQHRACSTRVSSRAWYRRWHEGIKNTWRAERSQLTASTFLVGDYFLSMMAPERNDRPTLTSAISFLQGVHRVHSAPVQIAVGE